MSGWEQYAACATVGGGMWDEPGGDDALEAVRICNTACTVREACLADAMEREAGSGPEHRGGIWGGLTPKQRARRARNLTPAGGSP